MTADRVGTVEARLRNRVGEVTTEDLGEMRRIDFLRFANATGDSEYLASVATLADGAPVPAPVLFLAGILHWTPGPAEAELRPDGLTERDAPGVGREAVNVMHGGQAITFSRPAHEGTRVQARRRLRRVDRKHGRSGPFLVVVTQTEFVDANDGVPLLTVDDTILVLEQ